MNKIYKVIWSKAKHTYVVASEIAKGHTKGETTGKGLKKLAAAMLVAAALLSPSFAWAADATTKFEPAADQASTTAVAVYTKDEADNKFATIDNLSSVSTEVHTQATQVKTNAEQINTNTTNINGLNTRVTALETADKNSVTEVTGGDAKLTITKGNGSTSEVIIDNVNHATNADSATTAGSATKATQDGNGNEISTTYATKKTLI
nr:ESPR domain-containing protein [uncultured Dialister sp.]